MRAILVLVPVSSMNTSFFGSRAACPAFQRARCSATSGRSRSLACSVFFEADPVALEEPADRALGDLQPKVSQDPTLQLRQRQERLLLHQVQQPGGAPLQRRAADRLRPPRPHRARRLLQRRPADRRRPPPSEPRRRLPPRRPRGHRRHNPFPKIVRMRCWHARLPNQRLTSTHDCARNGIPPAITFDSTPTPNALASALMSSSLSCPAIAFIRSFLRSLLLKAASCAAR